MAVDFSTFETDPATGLPKKKQQQLPYLNENSGGQQNMLPIVQPQQATAPGIQQGNMNVLGQAQNTAMQPATNNIQQQTQQMTQKMMTDPNFGYNPAAQKANALSNYDATRAQAGQAFRQQFGDIGGSGEVQANLLRAINEDVIGRSNLENEMDMTAYDTQKKNWTDAINAGLTQSSSDEAMKAQNINNLLNVRNAYEGQRSQEQGQKNTLEQMATQQGYTKENLAQQQQNTVALQKLGFDQNAQQAATEFGYDLTKLKTAQDFTAIQQDIQNKLALAMQSNDSVNAQKLETLRGQITSAQQMQQQENAIKLQKLGFDQTTQTLAQQFGYDLTKLKTVNDFTAAQEDIKNKLAVSMQGTDIKAQQDLTTLKGKIDAAAQQAQQKNAIELMNLGYEQDVQKLATQQGYDLVKLDKTFGNDITKLITATNLDTQSKSSLMELQDQLDSGKLLTQQNFTAIQNDLDRQLTIATQSNDIAAQERLTTLKGQIDSAAQAAQNEFSDSQRVATQAWQTGENISEQDFQKASMYYDWAQKRAEQTNDIEAQKQIEQMRNNTQLTMQMNGMDQETRMAFLESQLAESAASGDFARQKSIMTLAYTQDLNKMATEQGYDVAKIAMQGQIETALQEGNFDHAEAMQNTLLTEQAKQASLNRGVQTLELMLQQKGIDLNAQNAEWDRLKAGVEAGTVNPDALRSFLQKTATTNGLKIEAPDPMAVYKEVQQQMQAMKQEFGLTHPDMVANPATGELNSAGQKAFNDFFNKQMYSNDVAASGITGSTATSAAKTTTQKTSPASTNVRQW
jgi:predicted fused transcriptional regulator/phosphomethylpyrimidine kinase